jgi:hypothetical protein
VYECQIFVRERFYDGIWVVDEWVWCAVWWSLCSPFVYARKFTSVSNKCFVQLQGQFHGKAMFSSHGFNVSYMLQRKKKKCSKKKANECGWQKTTKAQERLEEEKNNTYPSQQCNQQKYVRTSPRYRSTSKKKIIIIDRNLR